MIQSASYLFSRLVNTTFYFAIKIYFYINNGIRMKHINFGLFAFFVLCCSLLQAQKAPSPFVIEAQYSVGKVLPIYSYFPKTNISNNVELFLGYQTYGKQQWNNFFKYPRIGMSLLFQELGNSKIMGQVISFVPTVYFPTTKKENAKVFAEIRYGLGLACITSPYNSLSNPNNKGAGGHVAWQFEIGANLRWNITKQISLQTGVVFYHLSNAHTKLPNVGVNNFAGTIGLLMHPFGKPAREYTQDSLPLDKKWHVSFRFSSGFQERGSAFGPVGGKKYPVYSASLYTSKLLGKIVTFKTGFTYRYYPLYKEFNETQGIFQSNQVLGSSAFIWMFGFEFLVGRFGINLESGVNLYKPGFKQFHKFYEESTPWDDITKQYFPTSFGLNYYILNPYKHPRNNVFIGAAVAANFGQAEFLELSIGYRY